MNEGMENLKEIEALKKRAEEAEGELSIIKGIGNNSPEMKSLRRCISELKAINKHHQKLNGELQEKLSKYEDKAAHYRRKAIL